MPSNLCPHSFYINGNLNKTILYIHTTTDPYSHQCLKVGQMRSGPSEYFTEQNSIEVEIATYT